MHIVIKSTFLPPKEHEDSEELITGCVFRTNEIKRYFMIIGGCCVLLVLLIFLLIVVETTSYGRNEIQVPQERHKREVKTRRSEFMNLLDTRQHTEKCRLLKKNIKKEPYKRSKRQTVSIDPNDHHDRDADIIAYRKKRSEYEELNTEFQRCKKSQQDQNKCLQTFYKLMEMSEELNAKLKEFNKMFKEHYSQKSENLNFIKEDENLKLAEDSDSDMLQQQRIVALKPFPRIHEDLMGEVNLQKFVFNDREKTIEDLVNSKQWKNINPNPRDDSSTSLREKSDDKIATPLKNQNFGM